MFSIWPVFKDGEIKDFKNYSTQAITILFQVTDLKNNNTDQI
jgi:hypothetical protein